MFLYEPRDTDFVELGIYPWKLNVGYFQISIGYC